MGTYLRPPARAAAVDAAVLRARLSSERDIRRHERQPSPESVIVAPRMVEAAAKEQPRAPVFSSGVNFYPPSETLWRIGGKWYDFEPFLELHPGGAEVVRLARDRFEDSTFAFESHHHNYAHARAAIAKYEVPAPDVLLSRPAGAVVPGVGGDGGIDRLPELLGDEAFYSTVRRRLTEHLRAVKCPSGGPTRECIVFFWATFGAYCLTWLAMFLSGSLVAAVGFGLVSAILGAFGHNWVHQPKYRGWAYLSLDTIGFSSTSWYREHVLQHHMYTNTPWDNHFRGTEPFLVTDPTVHRHWIQSRVMPYINPLVLTFGLWGNYAAHLGDMLKGTERWRLWKLAFPLNVALHLTRWGLVHGALLSYTWTAVLGLWYFTMALMNHNAEHCMRVEKRNRARDWGEAQLHSCADWSVGLPFHRAWIYLWLNYHTVHHLFPKLDFSHHPAAQKIILEACQQHGVHYVAADSPWTIYKQMVHSFATPQSLFQSILVYGGHM